MTDRNQCGACGAIEESWHQCGPKDWAAYQASLLRSINAKLGEVAKADAASAGGKQQEPQGYDEHVSHNCAGPCPCERCAVYRAAQDLRDLAHRMNNATPEQIARAMEQMPTDALEFGVKFESLPHQTVGRTPEWREKLGNLGEKA